MPLRCMTAKNKDLQQQLNLDKTAFAHLQFSTFLERIMSDALEEYDGKSAYATKLLQYAVCR